MAKGLESPGGATVNSQGRKPLEMAKSNEKSPGGAKVARFICCHFRPFGALIFVCLVTRGLRPWLLTVAPPGLEYAQQKSKRQAVVGLPLAMSLSCRHYGADA
jgi:hypothetical protein